MPGLEPGVVVRCGASFMGSALRRRLSVDRRTDHRDEGPVCQTSPRRRRRSPRTRTASLYPWHSTRSQAISPPGTEWTFSASRSGHHVDAVVRGAGSVLVAAGVAVRLVSGADVRLVVQVVAGLPVLGRARVPQRVEGGVVAVGIGLGLGSAAELVDAEEAPIGPVAAGVPEGLVRRASRG